MRGIRLAALDRLTWVVVAAVAILTVAALGALLISRPNPAAPVLRTPEGVVTAFVQRIQAGDGDGAWSLVSPSAVGPTPAAGAPGTPTPIDRPATTKDDFKNQLQYSHRDNISRIRITRSTQSGDVATVQLEITTVSSNLLSGASSHTVTVTLARQGGTWLITSDPSPWQFQ